MFWYDIIIWYIFENTVITKLITDQDNRHKLRTLHPEMIMGHLKSYNQLHLVIQSLISSKTAEHVDCFGSLLQDRCVLRMPSVTFIHWKASW